MNSTGTPDPMLLSSEEGVPKPRPFGRARESQATHAKGFKLAAREDLRAERRRLENRNA